MFSSWSHFRLLIDWCWLKLQKWRNDERCQPSKGGFYSFAISSNIQTLLFSWAWILKFWDFKGLKSCHIRAWSSTEGSNKASFCFFNSSELQQAFIWHDLSPLKYHKFKIQAQENNKVRLFEEMTNASVPSE